MSEHTEIVDGQPRILEPEVESLGLTTELIASELGYPDGEVPDMVMEPLVEAMKEGPSLLKPRAMWIPMSVDAQDRLDGMTVGGRLFSPGVTVGSHLENSKVVAVFVATVGPDIENKARELMKGGEMLEGYALDMIGSTAVEAVADVLQKNVGEWAEPQGWKCSNRVSPGYCGWNTEEQQILFALLPENPVGIRLSESSLMFPIKSVSGFIGIGPDAHYSSYTCEFCDNTNCYKRKIRAARHSD